MKAGSLVGLSALIGLAFAQGQAALGSMPQCAVLCSASLIPSSNCSATDMSCICANKPLSNEIAACVMANCTVKEALTTTNITYTACGKPVRDATGTVTGILIAFSIIGIGSAVLRLIARPPWSDSFGMDDFFALLAVIVAIPGTAMTSNLGRDIWTLDPEEVTNVFKFFLILMVCYSFILCTTKLSMLCFYLRVFPKQSFRRVVYALLALCACVGITFITLAIFQCTPVSYFWTMWTRETSGTCININAESWSQAIINIVLDVSVISLPIPQVLGLKCSRRKYVQILAMFGFGFFITVVSCVRLHVLNKFKKTTNPSWDYASVSYWSNIEIGVSIFCVCLPSLAQLCRQVKGKISGTTTIPTTSSRSRASGGSPSKRSWAVLTRSVPSGWLSTSSSSSKVARNFQNPHGVVSVDSEEKRKERELDDLWPSVDDQNEDIVRVIRNGRLVSSTVTPDSTETWTHS